MKFKGTLERGLRFEELAPEHLSLLGELCPVCLYWESPAEHALRLPPLARRRRKAGWLAEHGNAVPLGWVALQGERAAGFIQFGRPRQFPTTTHLRAGAVSADALFVSCLIVAQDLTAQGLDARLLDKGADAAGLAGCAALETLGRRNGGGAEVGSVDRLLQLGFRILRDDAYLPLLRRELASISGTPKDLAVSALAGGRPSPAAVCGSGWRFVP